MSNTNTNGGPAVEVPLANGGVALVSPCDGMTLRDYFAAHAPIGVADANEAFYRTNSRNPRESEMLDTLAVLRSRYADAMLKAREAE